MAPSPGHAELLTAVAGELISVREQIAGIETLVSDLVRRAAPEERAGILTAVSYTHLRAHET